MAYNYIAVSTITPEKETWNIRVKIVHYWIVHDEYVLDQKNYLEQILMEEQGTKIQATIFRKLIRKFENIVRQGLFYTVSNVSVAHNCGTILATKHPYKLRFHPYTSMHRCSEFKLNKSEYDFTSFKKIQTQPKQDDVILRDIIGFVVRINDVEVVPVKGVDKKKLDVMLEEESCERITCTLWEGFCQQIMDYVKDHPSKPMVIVLQYAKVNNRMRDKSLSNSLFASCLSISANIPEVNEFIERIERRLTKIPVPTQSCATHRSRPSQYDDFTPETEISDLAELHEINEESYCVAIATVHKLITNYNWFFYACKRCNRKVEESEGQFHCPNCSLDSVKAEPRFKVYIRIMDETGCTSLVLFDKDVYSQIGKTTVELLKDLDEKGLGGSFPVELDWFVGRKFIFRSHVSNFNLSQSWNVYTVKKVSSGENLIKAIEDRNSSSKKMFDYTDHSGGFKSPKHTEKDKQASSSVCDNEECESFDKTPQTKKTSIQPVLISDRENEKKSTEISVLNINEGSDFEEITLESKRKASTLIAIDDEGEGSESKLSSTKVLKKVKIEKDSEWAFN